MINIAELLKDAPKGMKLYSPLFGEVKFVRVDKQSDYPITVTDCKGNVKSFTEFGVYLADHPDTECLIFPSKDCRTWEGWKASVGPKFKVGDWITDGTCKVKITAISNTYYWYAKNCILGEIESIDKEYHLWSIEDAEDGDVITNGKLIVIFNKLEEPAYRQHIIAYVGLDLCGRLRITEDTWQLGVDKAMPATQEQRALLFKKMHEAGYQWYAGRKELCKIIEPKFKVGDDIKIGNIIETIAEVAHAIRKYYCESGMIIYFENQDLWHLVPKPHYDIANFKPKQWVLVRDDDEWEWALTRFSYLSNGSASLFVCINGASFQQCIPFEGNEHLLGTTDMPSEEYINW